LGKGTFGPKFTRKEQLLINLKSKKREERGLCVGLTRARGQVTQIDQRREMGQMQAKEDAENAPKELVVRCARPFSLLFADFEDEKKSTVSMG
jgi:acetolactate synthase regulatory subunit